MSWSNARTRDQRREFPQWRNVLLVVLEYADSITTQIRDEQVLSSGIKNHVVQVAAILSQRNWSWGSNVRENSLEGLGEAAVLAEAVDANGASVAGS